MDIENTTDIMTDSFDIVARQDKEDEAIESLRSDVDEVKARVDKIGRAAVRPAIGNPAGNGTTGEPSAEVKGFVDGYLRRGRETEIKSITGATPVDGGYAVPREIDAMIAQELKEISPVRQLAQVVQVGSAG